MDRTITVQGVGVVTAMPDTIEVSGEISGRRWDYDEAVEAAASVVSSLRKSIGEAGFDMDGIRTVSYSVNVVYEHDEGEPRFAGYQYRHAIQMTESSDPETVGRLLGAFVSCESAPSIRIGYTLKDPSVPMADARKAAVKDAKHKARELAQAAGVKLGDIIGITYGSGIPGIEGRVRMMSARMANDVIPQDLEFRDEVTMSWQIL